MTGPAGGAAAPATGEPRLWGLMAEFTTVEQLLRAAEKVRDAGYKRWDVHTPFPVHGLNDAMGARLSRLPWVSLAGGLIGGASALLMQWWMNGFDYAVLISGKPYNSIPTDIPVVFELTVLLSGLGAFLGILVRNRLPHLYHPLFRSARFRRVTTDRFFIVIEAKDPKFDRQASRELLESLGGGPVEEVED